MAPDDVLPIGRGIDPVAVSKLVDGPAEEDIEAALLTLLREVMGETIKFLSLVSEV